MEDSIQTELYQLYGFWMEGTLTHLCARRCLPKVFAAGVPRRRGARAPRPRPRKIEQHEVYLSSRVWIRTLNEHESWRPSASASRNNQKRWWESESDASAARRHLTLLAASKTSCRIRFLFFLHRAAQKSWIDDQEIKKEKRELN